MTGLNSLLSPTRVMCRVEASSKKRIFEIAAQQIAAIETSLTEDEVYSQLLARERLGSTGLGEGVAVPHCRVNGAEQPVGCLISLADAVEFDSPDRKPVDLLFVLLVPPEATQEHLDLLADIARRFSNNQYCKHLRSADSVQALFSAATDVQAA